MSAVAVLLALLFGLPFASYGEELSAPAADSQTRMRWSAGAGMEGRVQQEVNPDFPATRVLPQLFTQFRWGAWSAALEGGFWEKSESQSGALSVESRSLQVSIWGRYNFKNEIRWSPFFAGGIGAYFDTVESRFADESDTRTGRRDFIGAGLGLSHELWRHVQLEGELHTALVEDRKDIALSGIFRLGFLL